MPKRMLIDASHPEETRVVVLDGNKVEEFDFEAASRRPLKGNIYLAKVTRVEPSLQAAFVEYGGNRQGFLAFSEIHPDYYQVPVADRMAILAAQAERMMADEEEVESVDLKSAPALKPDDNGEPAEEEASSSLQGEADNSGRDGGENAVGRAEDNGPPPFDHESEIVADTSATAAEAVGDGDDEAWQEGAGAESETSRQPAPLAPSTGETGLAGDERHGESEGGNGELFEALGDAAEATEVPESESPRADVQAEATGAPVAHRRREHRPRPPRRRQYKIQEVIKRRQIMLVQVVKEERGNKGASLTTFLSLAGRYCVLMPNTPRGGGISRKITNAADRKRLKSAAQSLELPEGMGLIIRTAGANRTKVEIKRDYEYLLRLWDTVRELTLKSNAPALVYEEGSLIKRAIRDLYSKDISEILVDGETSYRDAKEFMRMLMPSHAKNVKLYKEALPLFQRFHVESQLDAMFSPIVNLRSGGYIVINQTEALVSIDVNSGKATREHSIEETATKTNLEAADEIARQLRLRDLAGLIVVDFIDMEDPKNDRIVEKRLHNAVRSDRARIQIGKISQFGLLEMSRQRLRAGVLAGSTIVCPHCNGQGFIRSTESAALRLLRALDEEGQRQPATLLSVRAPTDVTIYTLNHKRREIMRIEEAYDLAISFDPQDGMMGGSFEIERTGVKLVSARPRTAAVSVDSGFVAAEPDAADGDVTIAEPPAEALPETESGAPSEGVSGHAQPIAANGHGNGNGQGKRRRRRRRRGRGRGPSEAEAEASLVEPRSESGGERQDEPSTDESGEDEDVFEEREEQPPPAPLQAQAQPQAGESRRRRRRRGRRGRRRDDESVITEAGETGLASAAPTSENETLLRSHSAPQANGTEIPMPNTPSSPQWSFADVTAAPEPGPARPPDLNSPEEKEEELAPATSEVAPDAAAMQKPPPSLPPSAMPPEAGAMASAAPVTEASETQEPREPRKGWWQRRFRS